MYDLGLPGLVLAYIALSILLLSLYLYSNWNWWIKAGATLAVALFYYATYVSIPPLLGWPTSHDIPKQFRLIAFSVEENKGIYIWANDLKNGVELSTPRAYILPYNKDLHLEVEIAGAKIRRGGAIIGEIVDPATSAGPKTAQQEAPRTDHIAITFLDAPEALIPE